jgi:Tfp pilus assembly protein PilF
MNVAMARLRGMATRRHVNYRRVATLFAAIWLSGEILGETNTATTAAELLRQGYLAVIDAQLAQTEKNGEAAKAAYRFALGLFGRLQTEYPGWQGDVVSYRIMDCNEALARLEAPPEAAQPGSSRAGAGETNAVASLARLTEELRNARALLAADRDAAAAGTGRAGPDREAQRLREERDQAVDAYQTLARKTAKLEAQLGRRGVAPTNAPAKAVAVAVRAEARRMTDAGDYAGAMTLLREACAMRPEETDLKVLLGGVACRAGRFDEAVSALKPFDVKDGKNAVALLTLGTAYMGQGKVGDARVVTEKALAIDPKSVDGHYNMAQILLTIRPPDPDAAQRHYRRARELGLPADADFENTLRVAAILSRIKKKP